MTATLLRPGALEGRAVAADGACATACAAAGATIVVPGPRSSENEVVALIAFLASAGGDYLSGCRFALR